MSAVGLTSINAFVEPLNYHHQASLFLQHEAVKVLSERATPVLSQLQQNHPHHASQLSRMITDLSQRLTAEGKGHEQAVAYLQSHRQFLAEAEARLSGTSAEVFPPPIDTVPDWLHVRHTAPAGCFGAFSSFMDTYEHDLYQGDKKLREFEDVVWRAINNPDSFRVHVGWSGNPLADGAADIVNAGADQLANDPVELALAFVRDHESDIRHLIDTGRKGLEAIFLSLVDGELLQTLIDHVAALLQAYWHHISDPFVPTTHGFAANYQPPRGQTSYHDSLATVSQHQANTLEAMTTLLAQLQSLQTFNEQLVSSQLAIGGLAVIMLVAVVAVVVVFLDAPVSLAGIWGSVEGMLGEIGVIGGLWESVAGAFAAIEAATWFPAVAWTVIALGAVGITAAVIHSHQTVGTGATTYHYEPTILRGKRQVKQNLSPDEINRIAQQLAKEFGDVAEEDIKQLLRIFGNEEVVRYFLTHLKDLRALGLGKNFSVVDLFKIFVELATEGKEFRVIEGIIGLYFFLQGMALERSTDPAYEFTNKNDGTHWDVKSFTGDKDVDSIYSAIRNEVQNGEHVMIDTTNMTEDEANALARKLAQNLDDLKNAQSGFDPSTWFKWYPPRVWP